MLLTSSSAAALRLSSAVLGSALVGLASASENSSESSIQWDDAGCPAAFAELIAATAATGSVPLPIDCANLTVPLDYTQPGSNLTIDLQLARIPALKQPSRGSIIVHFGGPGLYQTQNLVSLGEGLALLSGQGFDLVSWDQRGTGATIPFNCFETNEERELFTAFHSNIAVAPNDTVSFGRSWALNQRQAEICYSFAADKPHDVVGTVDTVMDVLQIVDALGGDRKARFWGISYGTAVGATLAALYPERVERLLLDSVVNIHQWYSGEQWEMQHDSDKTLSGFFRTCFEKPELCSLAAANPNSTAGEVEEQLYEKFDELRVRPLAFTNTSIPGAAILDDGQAKSLIRAFLYNPVGYPFLSQMIQLILADEVEEFAQLVNAIPAPEYGDSSLAITCSDNFLRTDDPADVVTIIEKSMELSRFLGDWVTYTLLYCASWKLELKQRFVRGFNDPVVLSTPPLLAGTEHDVVTPLISAVNASASFPGSSVLRFNTFGHGLVNQPSLCTAKAVREYFEDGVLPPTDTVCEPAAHPWENTEWDTLFDELGYERPSGGNGTASNGTAALEGGPERGARFRARF
ncbi:TAP domain-containing protein [Colletotrichum sojae]|uniref:TAP domain-containing protein n=1 Tax=Colletotrichum sojae TaxID=2175907 RepID=A0A8H6MS14_9PEZI|nr:TAP domain-containing protein [Colletotrichum sojae]